MKNAKITILFLVVILLAELAQGQSSESLSEIAFHAGTINDQPVKKSEEEKFAEAMELFIKAINLRPDYVMAYDNRGTAFYRAGHIEKAFAA